MMVRRKVLWCAVTLLAVGGAAHLLAQGKTDYPGSSSSSRNSSPQERTMNSPSIETVTKVVSLAPQFFSEQTA
jgi:hypothetical protein